MFVRVETFGKEFPKSFTSDYTVGNFRMSFGSAQELPGSFLLLNIQVPLVLLLVRATITHTTYS